MVKTLSEIYTILNGITGFSGKVTYSHWPIGQAPALPFICYLEADSDNFFADGITYQKITTINIELYSIKKDLDSESAIETALTNNGIAWEKSETFLNDENCFMITYKTEV